MMKASSVTIAAIAAVVASGAEAQVQRFSSGLIELPIVDGPTTTAPLGVPARRVLADVDVWLSLTHTYDADLDIVLLPPHGLTYVHLSSDNGGSGDNMLDTVFDDEAATSIVNAAAPMIGRFRPEGGILVWQGSIPLPSTALPNLAALRGGRADGVWTLLVDDDVADDVGVLHEWGLDLIFEPSVDPTTVVTVIPSQIPLGQSAIVTAVVTPGSGPVGTFHSLIQSTVSNIHQLPIGELRDDGVFPDALSNDLVFSAFINVPLNAALGADSFQVQVFDEYLRTTVTPGMFEVVGIPVGACCVAGVCSELSLTDCAAQGGTFLGEFTTCQHEDEYVMYRTSADFEDISATGSIGPTGDDSFVQVPLGFEFEFWGNLYSEVFISSNGLVSFGAGWADWQNGPIPSLAGPNNAIYALWDDFNPAAGGHVYFRSIIDPQPGLSKFIVQWDEVPQFGQSDSNTFQLILYEGGGVRFSYEQISVLDADDATVGLENVLGTVASSVSGGLVQPGWHYQPTFTPRTCPSPCLWLRDGCHADYNNDGGIDGDDVIAFFADWDQGSACADSDLSGGTDGDDVIAFFGLWDSGGSGVPGC